MFSLRSLFRHHMSSTSQTFKKVVTAPISNKLNYTGYMMQVPFENQRQFNLEDTHQDRVVRAFFTQFNDLIKVYEYKDISSPSQPTENYPRNSWYKVVIPLGTNTELRFKFQRFYTNAVRIGRLLELMDYVASTVAYKYVKIQQESSVTIVTAVVDNIQFFNKISADQDLNIQGYVTYVGTSSVEVQIDLFQLDKETQQDKLNVSAVFLMVARDGKDHTKSYAVPKLIFDGESSVENAKLRYEIGLKNQDVRKQTVSQHLSKKAPQQNEIEKLHEFFTNRTQFFTDSNFIQINETILEKNMLMHIQDKNLHGKIFGGHLMREAFELGWLNAYLHVKGECYPETFHIDDIQFLAPVEIGSTLSIQSKVTYTQDNILHCQVECSKILPDNTKVKTNDMHLTFELQKSENVRQVYPRTYSEGMLWLEAKRILTDLQ